MYAQRMWGNDGYNGNPNNQLSTIQTQMQDNHNTDLVLQGIANNTGAVRELANALNCDFNTLNAAICDVRNGIDKVSGQIGLSSERVINAVNSGNCSVIQALNQCCCETQKEMLRMQGDFQLQMCNQTNTLSNGQRDLQIAIDKGFASTAYETQRQTTDIVNNQNQNTQRLIDLLNNHWVAEDKLKIQDLKFELSQKNQNEYLAKIISEEYHRSHHFCNNGSSVDRI